MLEVFGGIFIIVVGCLAHFMYDWTKHNKIVGYFTAVNESTWEHMKLILGPSFLWLIVEIHCCADNPGLWLTHLISLLVMLVLIPAIFYTYRHFTKKDILALDIATFVIAVVVGEVVFALLINNPLMVNPILAHLGMLGLIAVFLYYVTRTYVPERNFLSEDPITHRYGIAGHAHQQTKKSPKSRK